jgi:hypothetical protein
MTISDYFSQQPFFPLPLPLPLGGFIGIGLVPMSFFQIIVDPSGKKIAAVSGSYKNCGRTSPETEHYACFSAGAIGSFSRS